MPKPRERIATGLTISDILSMPVSKLQSYTEKQQRELISRVGSAVNKRYKNLSESGIENSATVNLKQSGGKISVRNKTGDELKNELIRAREFLSNPYSSKKEWNKSVKEAEQEASKYSDYTDESGEIDIGKSFAYYDIIRETNPEIVNSLNKYEVQEYIHSLMEQGLSIKDIIQKSIKWVTKEYNKQKEEFETTSRRFSRGMEYDDIPKRARNKRNI